MKYLKLSSVLLALFFAVGCGSKSVEKDGNTTQKTTEVQQEVDGQEPEEAVANPGGAGLPLPLQVLDHQLLVAPL